MIGVAAIPRSLASGHAGGRSTQDVRLAG